MEKILSYPVTVLYFICFGLVLVIFHPIQWVCLNVFGYTAHKKSVTILNFFIMRCTNVLGTRYAFHNSFELPTNRPIIIVSNHQSMYDIPGIIWYFRKNHPKFISKKELGKGIPSVSYNLRHGGSALIDRKDSRQALMEISKFGKYISQTKRTAVIFPEGTRSRTGKPKRFAVNGLKILFKTVPDAVIVPLTINNSWKLLKFGKFPMGLGNKVTFTTHQPIELKSYENKDQLILDLEKIIGDAVI